MYSRFNKPKSRFDGFKVFQSLVILFIVLVFVSIVGSWFVNTPGQTEGRATNHMNEWVQTNVKEPIKRSSCAHDSDGDGYASCTVATQSGEKIFLQCPSGFTTVALGASNCKEVEGNLKLSR